MHKGKDKSCGCQHDAPYGGRPRMPLTFGDGGFVSKTLTDDIDALVAEHYKGDEKLAARAKAMLKQLAFGGLVDKTSGSIDVGVDPDAGKSTAAFDLGLVKDDTLERKSEALEGTFKEELKDVGRFAAKTVLGTAAGVVDAGAAMLGADIDTSGLVQGMNMGEINPEEIRRREIASGIGSTIGATAATVVGGVVTGGNPNIIASGAGQAFEELGQIDEDNQALQTVSNIGETGAEIYGTVAGGVAGAKDKGLLTEVTDEMTKGEKTATRLSNLGSILGETVSGSGATGAEGIPNVSAAGGYIQMPHGGPDSEHETVQPPAGGTQFFLDYLGQFGGKEGESFGDIRDYAVSRIEAKEQALATEQADVERVRSEVLNQAQKIADGWANLSPESREYYNKLKNLSRNAEQGESVIGDLFRMQRNMPAELRAILPEEGAYNVHQMSPTEISTSRNLYCTPMGCLPYDQLLGGDMLTKAQTFKYASSNPRFVEGVKAGVIPFQAIDPSERQPGDIELQVDVAPVSYSDESKGYTNRPHHTTIYAGDVEGTEIVPGKDYYVDGRLVGGRGSDKMYPSTTYSYQAVGGDEEGFKKIQYDLENRKDYYRYVGDTPALEQALADEQAFLDQLFASDQGKQLLASQGPNIEIIKPQIPSYETPTELPLQTAGSSIYEQLYPEKEKKGLFGRKKDEGGSIDYKKGGSYQGGLRRWFKEKWVDVKTGKPCGRSGKEKSKRGYPYCRPSKRVSSKTPATSKHSAAKSRAAQKTGPKRVKPIMRKRSKK